MEVKEGNLIYHPIRLASGITIYLPTTIPTHLQKFIDTTRQPQDNELEVFKRKIDNKKRNV